MKVLVSGLREGVHSGGQLALENHMAQLFEFLLEVESLLLGLLLHGLHLVSGDIPLLVGSVGLLDNVSHGLPLLLQLLLQLLVEGVEDLALPSQTLDDLFELSVEGNRLVELLVGLVQPVL